MKIFAAIILLGLLLIVGFELYSYTGRTEGMRAELEVLTQELQKARNIQRELKSEYDYYQNPENLEKELRSRFNYRGKDEKLIIIVPQKRPTSTPQSP